MKDHTPLTNERYRSLIKLGNVPQPLDLIIDDNPNYDDQLVSDIEKSTRLAIAALDLYVLARSLTFALESVAHLQGRESALLPLCDTARALFNKIEGRTA